MVSVMNLDLIKSLNPEHGLGDGLDEPYNVCDSDSAHINHKILLFGIVYAALNLFMTYGNHLQRVSGGYLLKPFSLFRSQ